ncbi:protein translocase subunit SecF [Rickettsiales bacterium]|nr:protein translocase subunit SecF [Rickettsiales bacterium]
MAFNIIPDKTSIDFLGKKYIAFALSAALIVATIFIMFSKGLNFGIDFTGGILIEARLEHKADLGDLRKSLKAKNIGDISIQTFGQDNNILVRIGSQEGTEKERLASINTVKSVLAERLDGSIEYRKVDYVGPKVGDELIKSGSLSMILAVIAILIYIWLRFEWHYGVGAVVALIHDAILTLGFFSFTQIEFNLSSIAAILTIIGYSINDSVVIFDRIRENVRKYKKMPIDELLNRSINDNLARTLLTSLTTLMALVALVIMGGDVVRSFSLSALFGVVVGTYSSIYIAAPILDYMQLRQVTAEDSQKASA